MTLFKREHHSQQYESMSGQMKTGYYRTVSRRTGSSLYRTPPPPSRTSPPPSRISQHSRTSPPPPALHHPPESQHHPPEPHNIPETQHHPPEPHYHPPEPHHHPPEPHHHPPELHNIPEPHHHPPEHHHHPPEPHNIPEHHNIPELQHLITSSEFDLDYEDSSYQEDYYDRVYEYQRVPVSMPPLGQGPSEVKRPRSSSTSSRHRWSRDRPLSKSSRAQNTGSIRAKLKMNELQLIKKELMVIKSQIDGLLHSLDQMDSQSREHTGSPLREDSLAGSPYAPSASSPSSLSPSPSSPRSPRRHAQRESPELGEASDDDHHTINKPSTGPEDDI